MRTSHRRRQQRAVGGNGLRANGDCEINVEDLRRGQIDDNLHDFSDHDMSGFDVVGHPGSSGALPSSARFAIVST